ncbi:RNA polymerase sigma factor [Nonomuraea gerenzanensis]|uniref:RNA polymerase ECF-subfamily sigma factor n=1 Tax=Nonomuraea gerenzanensis TaxID=93944 RepID=A0A1M4E8X1_9ACTN|nr:RNA polymerase sigma factor [Nonomuraea gerenzanensis]UBU17513.1 RNA polymerase sigma factor [Nonomuraea gerenzanensis]SBO95270.1 RNA polymerase ECF-subfamily sigma factor [Nonomuraea gerenzanensis]
MAVPPDLTGPPDPGADWEEIFTTHFAEIHRYIARRLSPDLADDLAAEVFLAAYRRGHDASRGAVRPWLYGIATHLVARHHRSELRKWKALGRAAERLEHSHEDATVARVAAGELTGRLAGALAALNRRDRDVVLLSALGGLSHAEVAAALDIPAGTVASRLNRARKQLRAALGDVNPLEVNHG